MGSVIPLKKSANSAYLDLKNFLNDKLGSVEKLIDHKLKSHVGLIQKMSKYHLNSGGKRIRALLTMGSAKLGGYSGGERDIKREQSILRDKINRLNARISSTEENMARFTGKGAQSIVDQAEKTIKGYQREIEEIKAKLKLLREAVAEK